MLHTIRNNKYLNCIKTLVVLMFLTGQSLAGVSECDMQAATSVDHSAHMLDSNDSHTGHDMSEMTNNKMDHSQMSDCCMDDCQCAQNTCSPTVTMLFKKASYGIYQNANTVAIQTEPFQTFRASSALFRPPIIC